MARPVSFPEADATAESRSGSGAGPLPTKTFPNSSASCWELDDEELKEIQQTRRIWVITDTVKKHQMDDWPEEAVLQPTMRVTTRKERGLKGW